MEIVRQSDARWCERTGVNHSLLLDRLAAHVAKGWKFLIHSSIEKDTAETKGVLFMAETMINVKEI